MLKDLFDKRAGFRVKPGRQINGLAVEQIYPAYRVIYRITGSQVIIYLIADGRRDMQSVLVRRLLGA
ncbi:hypothetical protein [Propionivibrio sp.]|uniref:hypothetical protein n=1 Tax=Propionivibrio sp. TaxID=2212460 RepID=UPI002615099E|nr:hypothetical protein [Propionivibrio sp.]